MGVISQTTDRVAVLYSGRLVETGTTRDVLKNPTHPYTNRLVCSTPRIERGFSKQREYQKSSSQPNPNASSKVLIAKNLTREFDLSPTWFFRKLNFQKKERVLAVDSVSFTINKGETYGLVGDSGSGKSTIAKMAVGLLKPSSGNITFDGNNLNNSNSYTLFSNRGLCTSYEKSKRGWNRSKSFQRLPTHIFRRNASKGGHRFGPCSWTEDNHSRRTNNFTGCLKSSTNP